jgi:hypothetical protein
MAVFHVFHALSVTAGTGGTLDGLLATICLGQTVTRSVIVC